jgi:hypothetical protein
MAYVQSKSSDFGGAGTGDTQAFTTNNVAGNTLFFMARIGADVTVSVSDSQGNTTWQEDVHQVQSDDGSLLTIWSCRNCKAGANSITFSWTGGQTCRWAIAEYDGMLTAANFDVKTSSQSGSTPSSTPTSGSATPTTSNSLVLGVITTGGAGGTISAGSGYTLREASNATNRLGLEDKIITSTAGQTAGFSLSVSDTYNIAIAVYKMASSGGGSSITPTAGALTLTGQAPSVSNSGNANVTRTPTAGTLTFTGQQPVLTLTVAAPTPGTLTLSGFAPTLLQNTIRIPNPGTLTLSGQAPSIANSGGPVSIVPTAGALAFGGFFPTVQNSGIAANYAGIGFTRRRRR